MIEIGKKNIVFGCFLKVKDFRKKDCVLTARYKYSQKKVKVYKRHSFKIRHGGFNSWSSQYEANAPESCSFENIYFNKKSAALNMLIDPSIYYLY